MDGTSSDVDEVVKVATEVIRVDWFSIKFEVVEAEKACDATLLLRERPEEALRHPESVQSDEIEDIGAINETEGENAVGNPERLV